MAADIQVKGLRELEAALRRLPDTIAKRALGVAFRAGAREVVKAARAQAVGAFTSHTGATVRNVGLAKGKKPSPLAGRYVVGVRHLAGKMGEGRGSRALRRIRGARGLKKALADAGITYEQLGALSGRTLAKRGLNPYYFRFLELGTRRMTARPFLVPALAVSAPRVALVVRDKLAAELERVAREAKR